MIALLLVLAVQDSTPLTLPAAVERALAQYPSVSVARAGVAGAAAGVRESRATYLPRLSLDAQATRWQEPMLVYPLHSIPTGPASGPLPTFDRTLFQGSALVSWTLFDFGARGGRLAAARRSESAAEAGLGAAEQQLAARTAAVYLRVLSARGILAAQDQRLASLSAEVDRSRRMLAEGKAPRLQVLRAEAQLARARAERSRVAGTLDVAERELAQLLGSVPDSLAGVGLRDSAALDRETMVAQARAANPEVLQAARQAEAAAAAARAARATRLPELRLQAGLVPRASTGSDVQTEWQAGVALSWPLYTGGQRSAQIDRAEADARAARERQRLAELNAAQAVDRAIAAVVETRARVAALESAVQASLAVAETERIALDVGAGTQTDYLDALTDLLLGRADLIEARHAEIGARIELARVTGRLTPAWLDRALETR